LGVPVGYHRRALHFNLLPITAKGFSLQSLRFSGKFRNISSFLATQAKSDVWYTACYISSTGEIGGFSPFLHSTVAQTA